MDLPVGSLQTLWSLALWDEVGAMYNVYSKTRGISRHINRQQYLQFEA